jgi:hypothetical protein
MSQAVTCPSVVHAIEPVNASLPAFALVHLPLCSHGLAKACRTALGMLSSLLRHALYAAVANTKSWISRTAGHLRADGIASFDQHCSPHMAQGFISRPPRGLPRSHGELLGVVLGSLGRGMQADGVWAHLPATTGPIAAVPARGCPDGIAIRPGGQSTTVCRVPVSRPDA